MEIIQVTSTNISAVGYNKEKKQLRIVFKNGREFDYYDVPESVFQELVHSDSVGQYANQKIYKEYKQSRFK